MALRILFVLAWFLRSTLAEDEQDEQDDHHFPPHPPPNWRSHHYVLTQNYLPHNLTEGFQFRTAADYPGTGDPTNGFVNYVDYKTAKAGGLVKVVPGRPELGAPFSYWHHRHEQLYLGVDHTTVLNLTYTNITYANATAGSAAGDSGDDGDDDDDDDDDARVPKSSSGNGTSLIFPNSTHPNATHSNNTTHPNATYPNITLPNITSARPPFPNRTSSRTSTPLPSATLPLVSPPPIAIPPRKTWSIQGRNSIRLESTRVFNRGLLIADFAHMPGNQCGVWPAFWTYNMQEDPIGEIDIIEGINNQTDNIVSVHTGNRCRFEAGWQSGTDQRPECSLLLGNKTNDDGCGMTAKRPGSYGTAFNKAGGGVYATLLDDHKIRIWQWPRHLIPADIRRGKPEPWRWGRPMGDMTQSRGGCDVGKNFHTLTIIINTDFCGDNESDGMWRNEPECSKYKSCPDFVAAHPEAFKEAYWLVNYIRVYEPRQHHHPWPRPPKTTIHPRPHTTIHPRPHWPTPSHHPPPPKWWPPSWPQPFGPTQSSHHHHHPSSHTATGHTPSHTSEPPEWPTPPVWPPFWSPHSPSTAPVPTEPPSAPPTPSSSDHPSHSTSRHPPWWPPFWTPHSHSHTTHTRPHPTHTTEPTHKPPFGWPPFWTPHPHSHTTHKHPYPTQTAEPTHKPPPFGWPPAWPSHHSSSPSAKASPTTSKATPPAPTPPPSHPPPWPPAHHPPPFGHPGPWHHPPHPFGPDPYHHPWEPHAPHKPHPFGEPHGPWGQAGVNTTMSVHRHEPTGH